MLVSTAWALRLTGGSIHTYAADFDSGSLKQSCARKGVIRTAAPSKYIPTTKNRLRDTFFHDSLKNSGRIRVTPGLYAAMKQWGPKCYNDFDQLEPWSS